MKFSFYLFLIVGQDDTQNQNPGSVSEKERRMDGDLATTLFPQSGHMLRPERCYGTFHFQPLSMEMQSDV